MALTISSSAAIMSLAAILIPAVLAYPECGRSKYPDAGQRNISAYIKDGLTARNYEFPWTVAIRIKDLNDNYAQKCMGALIRPDWVITAAHCLFGVPIHERVVVLGQTNIYQTVEDNPWRQEFDIEDYIWHDNLSKDEYYEDDLALIKLKGRAELNENVNVICEPHWTYDYEGETAVVSGWGATDPAIDYWSPELKYFTTEILSNEKCSETYTVGVTDNMVCAGRLNDKTQPAPCAGDNASPLVVNRGGQFELVGIFNWSWGCESGEPHVYARMNRYLHWMWDIMHSYPHLENYP